MERMWENLNSRCDTTLIESRIEGLTYPSKLHSTFFNLAYTLVCLLESNYYKDEYTSDDMVRNLLSSLSYGHDLKWVWTSFSQ